LTAILLRGCLPLAIPAGRLAAQPPAGRTMHRHPSAVGGSSAQSGCRLSRASRGARFLLPAPPPRVTSTGCLCYFHRGRDKGRLHISPELWPGRGGAAVRCRSPGPLYPYKHAVVGRCGALERRNPLKYFHIHPKEYTLNVYFEPLLNPLPRRGRQPGARGRAASPPGRPHSNPVHPPNSLQQITG
jgi:hypothetical protein